MPPEEPKRYTALLSFFLYLMENRPFLVLSVGLSMGGKREKCHR
jgi:hypothetical protein